MYARMARMASDPILVAGRYSIQRRAERLVVMDVAATLEVKPDDRLLEIGCGPGNLLIPLSFMVQSAVGMDHPEVCRFLQSRINDSKIQAIDCNFFDYVPDSDTEFDKVLIYSVMNTLSDQDETVEFMDKAVGLIAPDGLLLLGDIANGDRKARFLASASGRAFGAEWRKELAASPQAVSISDLPGGASVFRPTDVFILSLMARYRERGFDTYLLPQPPALPFGNIREDLLIRRYPD